ncbi:MAG: hypothetical protein RL117_988 [Verrucomicrobiota bacterium]|jgi:hypothetical protein
MLQEKTRHFDKRSLSAEGVMQIFALRRKRKFVVLPLDPVLLRMKSFFFLSIAVIATGLSSCCAAKAVRELPQPTYQAPR